MPDLIDMTIVAYNIIRLTTYKKVHKFISRSHFELSQRSRSASLILSSFTAFCHPKLQQYIEGDLMELYDERLKEFGKRKADRKFIIDVLLLFRPGIIKPSEEYKNLNQYDMYKSYFKIGWRNLVKNKAFSFIHISGLALGLTCSVLIALWVQDEYNIDAFHKNADRI